MIKLFFISLIFLTVTLTGFSQKLKFKIEGQKDTTIFLVKYLGKGLYYADTAEMKNGVVEYDGSKQESGVLAVLLPGQKYFEFIYDNKEVNIETKAPDFVKTMVVKKSDDNKVFYQYMLFLQSKREIAQKLTEERSKFVKTDAEYTEITDKLNAISKDVATYQKQLVSDNEGTLVAKIIKMGIDIEIPESPKDADGKQIDSLFVYHYYRDHYFDNIDFGDDRLVNSSIFHTRLESYFSKNMMVQHWDTVIKYAFKFCDQLDPKSKAFSYSVNWITSSYEKSNIMGMDKVFVMMGDRYYCPKNADGKSLAHWMPEEKLDALCEKVQTNKNLVMGIKPPNLILRDTTDLIWKDFYSLKSEYTILYFWDPGCGHCKKTTPKMQTLYEKKFKDRNIEIFAIGKATGEDFKAWKKFINDDNLTFINVAVTESLFKAATEDARQFVPKYTTLESLNYQSTYDIFSLPRVFLLDKDKKIIGKQMSISQLEDMLDHLQNMKDAPKLFPPDPEEDEQMQH
jgi:thiol-disulfide isomerase/thioredoxin